MKRETHLNREADIIRLKARHAGPSAGRVQQCGAMPLHTFPFFLMIQESGAEEQVILI